MERAALGAADALAARDARGPFAVLIGPGNNGGDGSALARILHERAHEVVRIESSERSRLEGDAAQNARIADALGIPCISAADDDAVAEALSRARTWVDALLGIGQESAPRAGVEAILRQASAYSPELIVALDVPTGVCADTGRRLSERCLEAQLTVTFGHRKWAHVLPPARDLCGEVVVVPIGTADHTLGDAEARFVRDPAPLWARPSRSAHKNQHGHVLVLGGAPQTIGAGVLSARAALRSGAGLVTLATDVSAAGLVAMGDPAVMSVARDNVSADKLYDAVVAGPGWGLTDADGERLRALVSARDGAPWVWDADAVTWLARWGEPLVRPNDVLTPHPGELARLLGCTNADVLANFPSAASEAQAKFGGVLVAKTTGALIVGGATTPRFTPPGPPGMATAGSGDVLAGIIGGLLPRHCAVDAATIATLVHAEAGRAAEQRCGNTAMTSGDVAAALGQAFSRLEAL